MSKIVNENRLNLILTQHGLNRVAEAIADPSVNIEISSIKLGSGRNFEYYEPSEQQTQLEGALGLSFPIVEKALLEDNLTVSFRAIIPETTGNIDIREVGLYENYNGTDTLFAISTQQPFVKPSLDYGYVISIDYYVFLKTANVAEIYDQIKLDPATSLVSDIDLEAFMNTILFNHGNLLNQIGNNSRIIGYNRATQLYEELIKNQKTSSYIAFSKNYTDLLELLSYDPDKISTYWLFDHSKNSANNGSILDIGPNGINLYSTNPSSNYEQGYVGIMSTLKIPSGDVIYSPNGAGFEFLSANNTKNPFTMIFALEPLENETRTLLSQGVTAEESDASRFIMQEKNDGSVMVKLYTNAENYVTYLTSSGAVPNGPHSIVISYSTSPSETLNIHINGVKHSAVGTSTGNYQGILSSTEPVLSGISGTPNQQTINSKVGLVAVLKTALTDTQARCFSLILEGTLGINPYISRN